MARRKQARTPPTTEKSDSKQIVEKRSRTTFRILFGGVKAIIVFALLLFSFSDTYATSRTSFSNSDVSAILILGGAVNGALLLAVLICARRTLVVNTSLAIAAVIGVASTHAIHTSFFIDHPMMMLLTLAAAGFALFVAFSVIDRLPRVWLALPVLVSIAASVFVGYELWWSDTVSVVEDTEKNIRNVEFHYRPNLYFVSFDAIAPRVLLRKYMGLETTSFHDLFESRFRRFPNFFANAIYTRHSLGTLLSLDTRNYILMGKKVEAKTGNLSFDPMLFSGQSQSSLFRILKNNGYEIATAYEDEFFGKRKGAFVDHYFTGGNRVVCNLLDKRIRAFSFWGYCLSPNTTTAREVRRRVVNYLGEAAFRDSSQFALAHFYTPGHTDRSFRYSDKGSLDTFRTTYRNNASEAADLLSLLLEHLDKNDPQAILLVYGDHGPFLSKGVAFADEPEFVVQDHYGILGGIHPPTACRKEIDAAYARQGYMTLLDAAHAVLRCLARGKSALRFNRGHMLGQWHDVVPGGSSIPYERFLYE